MATIARETRGHSGDLATIDDLYKVTGKAELVDGRIVHMPLTGGVPNRVGFAIVRSLYEQERRAGGGWAFTDNVAFRVDLPRRGSFSPDASWHTGAAPTMKFPDGAPAFAAEVRSEGDYGPAAEVVLRRKRADYFAAGTLVVWDVDPWAVEPVRVYRDGNPDTPSAICQRGEIAEAEPAVPGWRMPVDDLFT